MPPTVSPRNSTFFLSSSDKVRLQELAPFFDIEFLQVDEETFSFCTFEGVGGCELSLPAAVAHRRLLAEICARAVKWVHFHLGASCRDSLLGQSEARLTRVTELYARDRDASLPHGTAY